MEFQVSDGESVCLINKHSVWEENYNDFFTGRTYKLLINFTFEGGILNVIIKKIIIKVSSIPKAIEAIFYQPFVGRENIPIFRVEESIDKEAWKMRRKIMLRHFQKIEPIVREEKISYKVGKWKALNFCHKLELFADRKNIRSWFEITIMEKIRSFVEVV
jgi:hypothetical protein